MTSERIPEVNGKIAPALMLYPYQRRWVQDDARFKIAMFARQCGKTFTSTLELALDCARAEALGQRRRWVILSRGERQAREAMNEGVKLALNHTSSLDHLLALERGGVRILVCGTCTNHFGITADIGAGVISNMFEITEALLSADKILSL